jgi:predicted ester cyclase
MPGRRATRVRTGRPRVTHSPVGPLPPNGQRVVMELLNIFRYDDQGRLVEEWVQTDQRSQLRQLGAESR